MQWKRSRQSCLWGKWRKCAPCPPSATSAFKSTAPSLFENSVRSQVCSAALVSQHPDALTPPILDGANQTQTCQADIPPLKSNMWKDASNVLPTLQSLASFSTCICVCLWFVVQHTSLFIPATPNPGLHHRETDNLSALSCSCLTFSAVSVSTR